MAIIIKYFFIGHVIFINFINKKKIIIKKLLFSLIDAMRAINHHLKTKLPKLLILIPFVYRWFMRSFASEQFSFKIRIQYIQIDFWHFEWNEHHQKKKLWVKKKICFFSHFKYLSCYNETLYDWKIKFKLWQKWNQN